MKNTSYLPALGLSDHIRIRTVYCYIDKCNKNIPRFNWCHAHFDKFQDLYY